MAGMDYSKVVEPDLRGLEKQSPRCNQRVDQLIEQVGDIYFNREKTKAQLLSQCGGVWQRRKGIYYDEEGIREQQIETVRYCGCGGYYTIQTAAEGTRFGDQSAFIAVLPRTACAKCRAKAHDEALREKKTGRWQYVFIQHIDSGLIETI